MPLTEDQREALRLELLARANERDRWINVRDRKLRAELDQARAQIRDCNTYTDLPDWERRKITPEMWAARKVNRIVYTNGAPARHELDLRVSWFGEALRRATAAEDAARKAEEQLAAKPLYVRVWEAERDLLRQLANDVYWGRLGRMTLAQAEAESDRTTTKGPTAP